MELDLFEIGKRSMILSTYVAIFTSIIALAIFMGGADRDLINIPLLVGVKPFYERSREIANSMPKDTSDPWKVIFVISLNLGAFLINFITLTLGLFIVLIYSILSTIPRELMYLASPLIFLFSFLQMTVYAYVGKQIIDLLRGFFVIRFP